MTMKFPRLSIRAGRRHVCRFQYAFDCTVVKRTLRKIPHRGGRHCDVEEIHGVFGESVLLSTYATAFAGAVALTPVSAAWGIGRPA
jgi:hypothetical protein